jgi:hypothetical protein
MGGASQEGNMKLEEERGFKSQSKRAKRGIKSREASNQTKHEVKIASKQSKGKTKW